MRSLLVALLMASAAAAQPITSPGELLRAMDDAVIRADYDVAEARAREAIGRYEELSPDQLVKAHSTLGVLLHTRSAPVEARSQFEAALAIDPALTLDPVLVSPDTRAFFETVREDFEVEAVTATPEVRYVVLEDRRGGAARRSLVAPGWGQFYKDDPVRGLAFASAAVVTGGGLLVSALQYAEARSAYLGATSISEADRLYPATNRWSQRRDAFAIAAGVVWSAAVLEALLTGAPDAPETVTIEPASQGLGLSLSTRL